MKRITLLNSILFFCILIFSCSEEEDIIISGCTDNNACNYESVANDDDGSCEYLDCLGNCDGSGIELDVCNVCDGSGECDCDNGTSSCSCCCDEGEMLDCFGVCDGGDTLDDCGVCGGDNSDCLDCAGIANGDSECVQTVSMSFEDDGSFSPDSFALELADVLGIDVSRIFIIGTTSTSRDTITVEILFLDSPDPGAPSVEDILADVETVETVGDYTVEVTINDPISEPPGDFDADSLVASANEVLIEIINAAYDCDHSYYYDYDIPDNCDDYTDFNIYPALNLFETALVFDSEHAGAHFGVALVSMFTITQDPILQEIVEKWQAWEENEDNYFPTGRNADGNFRSGLPMGVFDLVALSNIRFSNYIPLQYLFNSFNITNDSQRDGEEVPNFGDLQIIAQDVLIPRLTDSINHFEACIDQGFVFSITSDMIGEDEYQDPIELDDAEFYIMKGMMHFIRGQLYAIAAYNLEVLTFDDGDLEDGDGDPDDFAFLDQSSDFLALREGSEDNLPNAFEDLNNIISSLQGTYNFLEDAPYHENGVLTYADILDFDQNNEESMQSILFDQAPSYINETQDITLCNDEGDWIWVEECGSEQWEDCWDDYVCEWYDDGIDQWENCWWEDYCVEYDNYWCYDSSEFIENEDYFCYDTIIDFEAFMTSPPSDLKDIVPPYTIGSYPDMVDNDEHEETTNYDFDDECVDLNDLSISQNDYQSMEVYANCWEECDDDCYTYCDQDEDNAYFDINNLYIEDSDDTPFQGVTVNSGELTLDLQTDSNLFEGVIDNITFILSNQDEDDNWVYMTEFVITDDDDYPISLTYELTNSNYSDLYFTDQGETRFKLEPHIGGDWDEPITSDYYYSFDISLSFEINFSAESAEFDPWDSPPYLTYEWYSEDCWNGDTDNWRCEDMGSLTNNPYPDEYANNEIICNDESYGWWDGNSLGILSCEDCSEPQTFAEQTFANILADEELEFINYVRILYFPYGRYHYEPHWDYEIFYAEEVYEPCLTWNQNTFSEWQSAWPDLTFSGLFPDMTLNPFFLLIEADAEEWEQSTCDEEDN